ncbi:MAG: serine hydrolase domain-containing protein [Anaerolineae bacterium]|jgi:CubicO group peptidase (beta-lactamase class C family)
MRARRSQNWLVRIGLLAMTLLAVLSLSGLSRIVPAREDRVAHAMVDAEVNLASFEAHLETVRQALQIPGMSAAVVRDQALIWAKGFGYADPENQVPAAPDTPYGLASVTKPVAAVLIMQLVEEGAIDLDAPIAEYGVHLLGDGITVRHLLTHTSEGAPGTVHHYNGNRYALLGGVIEGATGVTFAELLSDRVLLPLSMLDTALNPVSSWGNADSSDWKKFGRLLGWGAAYRHYPDVYKRLAKPYQLDAGYNLIPGMYHLVHSPAAGLISSVADLARFDMALDQGLLLKSATMAEMWKPAVSTYNGRQDLMYGLGWYVQDFDGLQLRWHTGRWPPSTSALYLKVPEEGLTFIVLANTANLSTPFDAIGYGDVSKSTLALSFLRHFVYPRQHGRPLPQMDWSEAEERLVGQLAGIREASARQFVERELWSFRQAYASVGRADEVDKLWRVSLRAFPQSWMRTDWMFTQTVGPLGVVPPALSAAAYHRISWGVALWFALVLASLAWTLANLARAPSASAGEWVTWLLSTVFLGPFSPIAYRLVGPSCGAESPRWRQVLGASVLTSTAYTSGWILAISLLKRLGEQPHPLAVLGVCYLAPFLVTLICFRLPSWLSRRTATFGSWLAASSLTEVILLNVGFAVLFPVTAFMDARVFGNIPGALSPFFWAMLSVIAVLGTAAQFPITWWLAGRARVRGPSGESGSSALEGVSTFRTAWQQLVASLVVTIASLAIAITQLTP